MNLEKVDIDDLPENWTISLLGQFVAKRSKGIIPNKTPKQIFELYSVPSHGEGKPEIVSGKEIGSNKQIVDEGTVLLCKINPRINRTWVVTDHSGHQNIGSTEWITFPPNDLFDPKYLAYFMRQDVFRDFLAGNASGVGGSLMRVKSATVADYPFPIAPFEQQKRIVAEIEKQFSRLDEAVANLKRVKANLKRYKAAVLKAAVEGTLTEEWRKQHPEVEPADKLLERILAERRKKWEDAELAKMEAKSKVSKNDKWTGRYKEAELPKIEDTFDLPPNWTWTNLGQLAWSVKDGPHYSPKYSESGIPFISGGNIRPEGIDFEKTKFISRELHEKLSERCKPELGDLLYTKGGTTGIARINTEAREFNVWVHVAVLRLVDSIEKFYLQHCLNSVHCYQQSQRYTHGVGNQDLGLTRMIWITVPLPPLNEQAQIVLEIERHFSVISEVEEEVESNLSRADRLRQSILKQAFSGQLVPQDPNDEPASLLLERIRAQPTSLAKAAKEKPAPRRRTKSIPQADPNLATLAYASLDLILDAILRLMQPGKEYSRAEIADVLGLSSSRWNAAIQELKRRGKVRQMGERSGARYLLIR